MTQAACFTAHAILAHRGVWVTNEKQLLTRAGLRWVDGAISELGSVPPDRSSGAVRRVRRRLRDALADA